jgi:FkbM family methyltransferase
VPDCLSFIFQFKEIFVEESYKFKTQEIAPLIYDCGANIGMSCAYFKKIYPQATIKAFEADAKIAEILINNLQKNQIKDVEVMSKAVWTTNDGISISLEGADGASVFGKGAKTLIPSIRLCDLLAKEPSIAMLKMDIEGAETEVLLDCRTELSKIENIFIEYHAYLGQTQNLASILEVLTTAGFRYFIRNEADRQQPLYNQLPHNQTIMDLQLNIFAFRSAEIKAT